ncbi:outer membrane beta-barrel protein [Flavobacterium sp.]|uniref:outer membrane beta-barrel protein n=1 Tax=Flavobacterium sp. TaxID=239 RepID=UPI00333E496F
MKKIILSLAAVLAFSAANAQDKKESKGFGFSEGNIFVGGLVSYSSEKNDNGTTSVTTSGYEISPEVGYFLTDNFALTAGLSLGNTDNGTTKTNTFGLNVGGRYYFLNMGERFKTYTNFGFGIGSDDNGGSPADKTNTFEIGGGLGINYFVTPNLAIDFRLANVISYSTEKTGDAKTNTLELEANVFKNFFDTPSFGLIYKF